MRTLACSHPWPHFGDPDVQGLATFLYIRFTHEQQARRQRWWPQDNRLDLPHPTLLVQPVAAPLLPSHSLVLSLAQMEVEEERHTDFSVRRTNAAVDAQTPQSSFIFSMST
jgi:hypothetical protein